MTEIDLDDIERRAEAMRRQGATHLPIPIDDVLEHVARVRALRAQADLDKATILDLTKRGEQADARVRELEVALQTVRPYLVAVSKTLAIATDDPLVAKTNDAITRLDTLLDDKDGGR